MIVDEHVAAYINALESDLPEHLKILEQEVLASHVPMIRKEAQALLRFLLRINKPERILEVGTAEGFSCIFMSHYMPKNSKITTIEKVPMRICKAKKNISEAPRTKDITFMTGDALEVLKTLEPEYDFIFLDAAKGQYMNFLPELLRLLSVNGMLVTDNVLQEGSIAQSKFTIERRDRTIHMRMREYLHTLTHHESLDTVILPVGDGMTLSVKLK